MNNAISEGMARAKARRQAAVAAGKLPTDAQLLHAANKHKQELAHRCMQLLERISELEERIRVLERLLAIHMRAPAAREE